MSLTDDLTLKCLSGSPIFVGRDVCAIYPPTLRSIAEIGYDNFQTYINTILIHKPDLDKKEDGEMKKLIEPLSNFQYLIVLTQMSAELNKQVRDAFRFFMRDNVSFSINPPVIIVGPLEEKREMTEEIFMEFQNVVKRVCWLNSKGEQDIVINANDSPTVKALKHTMMKNREKLAKAKAKKKHDNSEKSDIEFSDLVASVAVGDCGLNIANIWDITYYAFHDQLTRMGWREQFDINNRAAMAGAKIKKQDLKHWIKSINSK